MGHMQPTVLCYLRTMSYTATGMLSGGKRASALLPIPVLGNTPSIKRGLFGEKPGGEKQEQPQV